MAENVIHVRTTRKALLQALRSIPREAQGRSQLAQALMTRIGLEALGRIRTAFVEKARGGTDQAGDRWRPLAKSTIAYSRRHPGLPPGKIRAKRRPSYALTPAGRRLWWRDYAIFLARYKGDKGHAAAMAWKFAKENGEQTLMQQYGDTPVEILRDTGLLLNSLSPGVRSKEQVFRVGAGEVIVGTNRKWAAVHHHGSRNGRIPQRRLWPEPSRWPQNWWLGMIEQLRGGLIDIALSLLRRKSA